MTAAELIALLQKCPQDAPVMILDGFNGGGLPREINLGPTAHLVMPSEGDETADCEELVGQTVTVLGFGCY